MACAVWLPRKKGDVHFGGWVTPFRLCLARRSSTCLLRERVLVVLAPVGSPRASLRSRSRWRVEGEAEVSRMGGRMAGAGILRMGGLRGLGCGRGRGGRGQSVSESLCGVVWLLTMFDGGG